MDETPYLLRALDLATRGKGLVSPNPMVGAVLVKAGRVVAEGYHAYFGGDHAEAAALRQAGSRAAGSTLYVTLEPCCHFGKTPPCADALIAAKVKRVVAAGSDPNPLVAGKGFQRLRAAGIQVQVGLLREQCQELNSAYFVAAKRHRPFVALKAAQSLDGKISSRQGESKWITGQAARDYGHRLRFEFDAILAGINTVLSDDPSLDYAPPPLPRALLGRKRYLKVILDSRGRLPLDAKLWAGSSRVVVAATRKAPKSRLEALRQRGAQVLVCGQGRVDLGQLLDCLLRQGTGAILVEGGAETHGSFIDAGLADRFYLFQAPLILGGRRAKSSVGGKGFRAPDRALRLRLQTSLTLGLDRLYVYRNN